MLNGIDFSDLITKERKCLDCDTMITVRVPRQWPGFGAVRCDSCCEIFSRKQDDERKASLRRDLEKLSEIPDPYKSWDKEKANIYGGTNLLKWLSSARNGHLMVFGTNGRGKSHVVAFAALKRLKSTLDETWWIHCPDFFTKMMSLKAGNTQDKRDAKAMLRRAQNVPHLILDDLGKEKMTEAKCELLWSIINERELYGRITWITTNHCSETFSKRFDQNYGPGIMARFGRMFNASNIYEQK